jgi:hypothetical protein
MADKKTSRVSYADSRVKNAHKKLMSDKSSPLDFVKGDKEKVFNKAASDATKIKSSAKFFKHSTKGK